MASVTCPFCGSSDTDHPYTRPSRIFILTRIFQRVRMWYCRSCARHFPTILPRSNQSRSSGEA
jgi:hypothetical protein